MRYKIEYSESVVSRDIPALDVEVRKRIKDAIERKLTVSPDLFGKPLRRSLRGWRSMRVGSYRIIFQIERKVVFIAVIDHRKDVYYIALKRLGL